MPESVIMSKDDMDNKISSFSDQIIDEISDLNNFAIVGIQTRGVFLAQRIKKQLELKTGKNIKSGVLDITFYRDDLAKKVKLPVIKESRLDFDISDMTLLVVDDVLFTGRTIKAALETLDTFGRAGSIKLLALVDRGNRELPIQADYVGVKIDTLSDDIVKVMMTEKDDHDKVLLIKE